MQQNDQSEFCLPHRPTDEVLRERLEAELRDAIFEFNAVHTEPDEVITSITRIRVLREKLATLRQ